MKADWQEKDFQTPMMQQYLEIKKQYPDCLLLFRLGDFYELFLEDAQIGSLVLGITLTSRHRGRDGKIPMCGIPYHALDSYLGKLIRAGYKVAICEQMEDASEADGMVRRDVVRVVTPGTVLDEQNLEQKKNNYLLSLNINDKFIGLAYADISTGELHLNQIKLEKNSSLEKILAGVVYPIDPAEIILSDPNYNRAEVLRALRVVPRVNIFPYSRWEDHSRDSRKFLQQHFGVVSLESFGLEPQGWESALEAGSVLLHYLKETQKNDIAHFRQLVIDRNEKFLRLDATTVVNLELFYSLRDRHRQGSLLSVLDETSSASGGRLLRQWILRPLREISVINSRLEAVDLLVSKMSERKSLRQLIKNLLDIERLLSRVSLRTSNPKDIAGLRDSLQVSEEIHTFLTEKLTNFNYPLDQEMMDRLLELRKFLEKTIKAEPASLLSEGGYIADGVSAELDECREIMQGGRHWLSEFTEREKKRTGISSLKVGRNKVFGFYIEISKANLSAVPENYIRKQTLVNAERFIIPELKEREEKTFQAQDQAVLLEKEIFQGVLQKIMQFVDGLQSLAHQLARIDVLSSLAEISQKNHYVRPQINQDGDLIIRQGRHPVVESLSPDPFIPNDICFSKDKSQIILMTGPNMAGKSTYLRQTAIITLMAQIGCFVPAREAVIPVRDQIFTRVGASDNLSLGQSTFLVEMMETANILHNCTPQSLVVFDEVGRGTSTFDGMSLAWSIIEFLAENSEKKSFVLFATHYHELTDLADKFAVIKNFQVLVEKKDKDIIFLHQVAEGRAWQSFGIEVAQLAGLPEPVVKRAQQILQRVKHNQGKIRVRKNPKGEQDKSQKRLWQDI